MVFTIEKVREVIVKRLSSKKFTVGDVYYELDDHFTRSNFGKLRNILVKLSKEGFLNYSIEVRSQSPRFPDHVVKGVVYTLKK